MLIPLIGSGQTDRIKPSSYSATITSVSSFTSRTAMSRLPEGTITIIVSSLPLELIVTEQILSISATIQSILTEAGSMALTAATTETKSSTRDTRPPSPSTGRTILLN